MKTQSVLIALLLQLMIPVKADIIPNPVSAPNLRPTEPTSVRMVSEIVSVDLYQDSSTVEVLFEMKNPGETETVEVGFPIMDFYFGWKTSLFVGQKTAGERFQVWVDEKPIHDIKIYGFDMHKVNESDHLSTLKEDIMNESTEKEKVADKPKKKESIPDSSATSGGRVAGFICYAEHQGAFNIQPWYIWKTTFLKEKTCWIKVRYTLPRGITKSVSFFNYLLHTGAGWDQTIGKATVQVRIHDIPDDKIHHIQPSGYTKEGNLITWIFEDFEPERSDNIFIYYYHKNYRPHKNRAHPNPVTYFDNQINDLMTVDVEDVASFSVVKDDTLNYPDGAIFVYSKTFYFTLVKELTKHYTSELFEKLSVLDTKVFFDTYDVQIEGIEDDKCDFKDLLSPRTEIKEIETKPGNKDKTCLIIRCKRN